MGGQATAGANLSVWTRRSSSEHCVVGFKDSQALVKHELTSHGLAGVCLSISLFALVAYCCACGYFLTGSMGTQEVAVAGADGGGRYELVENAAPDTANDEE